MDIAVIGDTDTAMMYAIEFSKAGHNVYYSSCDTLCQERLVVISSNNNINICAIEDAAAIADLIIVACLPGEVRRVSYFLGDVRRKVIIDTTSNTQINDGSPVATLNAIASITGSAHVIKCFHTKGYETLMKPLFSGEQHDMVVVTDSKKAHEITKIMMKEIGLSRIYLFGDTQHLILFDEMTQCFRKILYKPGQTSETNQLEDIQE